MSEKSIRPQKLLPNSALQVLHNLAYEALVKLEASHGINASGKEDRFAGFYGRDSMVVGLKLLKVHKKNPDKLYLRIVKNILKTAVDLQGKRNNPASGEEPGKIIHAYKKRGYYYLISLERPWYTYPDKTLRNYDSVDATPLFLTLAAEYYNLTKSERFLQEILPAVEEAFYWIETSGHKKNKEILLEHLLQRPQPYGGLVNQGWMDTEESLLIEGEPPKEPIALVEVQGYYFKALKLWASIYKTIDDTKAKNYKYKSHLIKDVFNNLFLMRTEDLYYFCQAIFGHRAQILEVRSNPGHCLWSSVEQNGKFESIIKDTYIDDFVARIMKPDLFEPKAGIRTLSTKSKFFDHCGYHNGSIWPFDNGLIAEGLENFGYHKEADKIKSAVLNSVQKLSTTIELYCYDGRKVKKWAKGKLHSAKMQAWTAVTILDFTT